MIIDIVYCFVGFLCGVIGGVIIMKIITNIIFAFNNKIFDRQLKKVFTIDKNASKICQYCGKPISENDIKKNGVWVDSFGTHYTCVLCDKEYTDEREEMLNSFCNARKWGRIPSIEQCVNCPRSLECEESKESFEIKFKERKQNG